MEAPLNSLLVWYNLQSDAFYSRAGPSPPLPTPPKKTRPDRRLIIVLKALMKKTKLSKPTGRWSTFLTRMAWKADFRVKYVMLRGYMNGQVLWCVYSPNVTYENKTWFPEIF